MEAATQAFKGDKKLPLKSPLAGAGLAVVVFRTQKYIWHIDMEDKRRRQSRPHS